MNFGIYPKLALEGIKKNKRLYIPYIFTCIGMAMIYYIVIFLNTSETVAQIPGGDETALLMMFGAWVIAIFSTIFLFYTNSFLMKRRKKEFGLYNILGMGKSNIGLIIFFENLFIYAITLIGGIFLGIVLSKLSELIIVRLVHGTVNFAYSISGKSVESTLCIFSIIFALLTVYSMLSVKSNTAINLIKSQNAGEKPPKTNWVFGILGIAVLVGAYVLALSVNNAIQSLSMFFIAVIMVIIGTYLLLISGSVMICRILQKCKNYYYQKKHFASVSSMAFRMKRNGAGLASICILSTMVLVTISTTSCIYFGSKNTIENRYPFEFNTCYNIDGTSEVFDSYINKIKSTVKENLSAANATQTTKIEYKYADSAGLYINGFVKLKYDNQSLMDSEVMNNPLYTYVFISQKTYNELSGKNISLNEGETVLCTENHEQFADTINFEDLVELKVVDVDNELMAKSGEEVDVVPTVYIVVTDMEKTVEPLTSLMYRDEKIVTYWYRYDFNTDLDKESQINLENAMKKSISNTVKEFGDATISYRIHGRASNEEEYYASTGGIIFIGIMLSVIFAVAAALIIYYKQLTEGYEDQERFTIMQNIGMTKKEIKGSINSQMLTVFFIPLLLSCCHLAFAFKMIRLILILFGITNIGLFAIITGISVVAFSLLYVVFYSATSNSYYKIVCGSIS